MRPGVLIAVVVTGMVLLPFVLRGWAALRYRGLTYTVETVPARRVAIVFGAQVYADGRPSPMLADRVATGVALWRAGKADVLLLTGDNRYANYNEPEAMRRYALSLGMPDEALVLDYAGRRTYDSCYRARDIFGVRDPIVVTQNFHLDRTLLTCRALGLDAVGVAADYQRPTGYDRRSLWYSRLRELPALTVALLEVTLLRPTPVLGDPLPIFPEGK